MVMKQETEKVVEKSETTMMDLFNESIEMYSKINRQVTLLTIWSLVNSLILLYVAVVLGAFV